MEPKVYSLIGLVVVLIIGFIVVPPVFDALDSRADIPSDSAWNALDDDTDLLKLLLFVFVLAAIIIGVVWVLFKNGIGGGGM